ncbi:hypothetical protein AHMF7616_02109 [Adhaeribacter pallidiroseus]|uniref:Uncharacterized protein n=2 Tax=Adhaeribacter pallidiroseus TaxID=2072847 RepID=A0A369QFM9_9BACT|nr:hypothetical protein AHMF7616_02109 [Adhaeribacter pallidiroseus]
MVDASAFAAKVLKILTAFMQANPSDLKQNLKKLRCSKVWYFRVMGAYLFFYVK